MFWIGSQTKRSASEPDSARPEKSNGSGRFTQRPWPKARIGSGMSGMGWPCVTTSVRLRAIISVPRVTMKEGMCALVTTIPANIPIAGPTSSGTKTPARITHVAWSAAVGTGIHRTISHPATAADKPTTAPTATSNSPEIMMTVMPAATISMIVIWPRRFEMLIGERKRSLAICMRTMSSTSTPSAWMRL